MNISFIVMCACPHPSPTTHQIAVQLLCLPHDEIAERMHTAPPSSPAETAQMLREIATRWPLNGGSLFLQINNNTPHYRSWIVRDIVSRPVLAGDPFVFILTDALCPTLSIETRRTSRHFSLYPLGIEYPHHHEPVSNE